MNLLLSASVATEWANTKEYCINKIPAHDQEEIVEGKLQQALSQVKWPRGLMHVGKWLWSNKTKYIDGSWSVPVTN